MPSTMLTPAPDQAPATAHTHARTPRRPAAASAAFQGTAEVLGSAVLAGARAALPLVSGIAPLALLIGATIAASTVPDGAGLAGSFLLFSGAAHLAAVATLDAGAGTLAAVAAVAIVNARLLVLSAALAPSLRAQPAWFRWTAAHFVVEPTHIVATTHLVHVDDPVAWRRAYLGAVAVLATNWAAVMALGVALGPRIPSSWPLEFAGPALLVAMLVPTLRSRPAVVAATVGAVVAVAAAGVLQAASLLAGGVAGMAAGVVTDRFTNR